MAFDVEGARRAGYTDAEIADYLAKQRGFRINDARKAGYSDDEIVSHLSKGEVKPEQDFLQRAKNVVGELVDGVMGGGNSISGAAAATRPAAASAPLDRPNARPATQRSSILPNDPTIDFSQSNSGRSLSLPAPVAKVANKRGEDVARRAHEDAVGPEDSWSELGRKFFDRIGPLVKQSVGGIGQALTETSGYVPIGTPLSTAESAELQGRIDEALQIARDRKLIPGQKLAEVASEDLRENSYNFGDNALKKYPAMIAESVVQMLPSIAASVVSRNPSIAGLVTAGQVGGSQYAESREAGRDRGAALGDSVVMGAAEAIGEKIPVGILMKPGGKFLPKVLKAMGAESLQETFTQTVQSLYDKGVLHPEMTWGEVRQQVIDAAIVGGGMGGSLAVGFGAFDATGRIAGRRADDTRTPGPGIREQDIADATILTPEDVASPLDNADIAAGRVEIAGATAGKAADNALTQAGLPSVGSKVNVTNLPGGASMSGVIEDVFTDDTGTGVVVRPEGGGSPMREYLDTLNELGVSITPSDALAEADAIDAALAAQASAPMEASSPLPSAGAEVAPSSPSGRTPSASADGATNFDIGRYMARVRQAESGGKDNAKAGTSSATGRYQFTDGTWLTTYKAVFGKTGENDAQILAKRGDGAVQDRLMQKLTEDNAAALRSAGLPVNDTTLYLAHFAGIGGARSILKVAPERSVETVLGKKAVAANSFLKGKTAGEVIAWAAGKMGAEGGGIGVTASEGPSLAAEKTDWYEPPASSSQQNVEVTAAAPDLPTGGDMAGPAIDKEWTAFAPDSGTIGIPRAEMPQVKAEHRGAMVNFLNARGIAHAEEEVAADTLKPSQAEFSPSKVEKAKSYEGGNRAILISADGYVVDGHHQWLAARDKGETVRAIRLDAPIREVLQAAHEFPSSETADGATSTNTAGPQDGGVAPMAESANTGNVPVNTAQPVGDRGEASPVTGPSTGRSAPIPARKDGKRDVAVTATGSEIPVDYAVVEMGDLVASNTPDGGVNPAYPADRQPRDRTRAASQTQIAEIASRLNPRLLGRSPKASDGAPIISPDGIVESGNGRTLALQRVYGENGENAQAYRQFIESEGFDTSGMKQPVLVRIRDGNMSTEQVQEFVRAANVRDTAGMSGTETAGSDAAAMPAQMVDLYRGGDIEAAGNRDFVKAFVNALVPTNERASMILADGSIAKGLVARMEAALLVRAFGQRPFIEKMVDATDSNIRAIGKALVEMAGKFAKLREAAQDERVDPAMDITGNIAEAVEIIDRARREGKPIGDYVNQRDIFSGNAVATRTEAALRAFFFARPDFTKPLGQARIVAAMDFYVEEAMKAAPGGGLFGESTKATPDGILDLANERRNRTEAQNGDLFSAARPGDDANGARDAQPSGNDERPAGEGVQARPGSKSGSSSEPVEPKQDDAPVPDAPQRSEAELSRESWQDDFDAASKRMREKLDEVAPESLLPMLEAMAERGMRLPDGDLIQMINPHRAVELGYVELVVDEQGNRAGQITQAGRDFVSAKQSIPKDVPTTEPASDVREALRTQLEKLRLAEKVKIKLVDTLGGAAGEYRAQIVSIAQDTPQGEVFTLNHEAIHVLRDLGLFNTSEWAILSAKARRETGLMRSIRQRYEAGFRERGMSGPALQEALIEEAVADMFARHQDGRYKAEGTTDRLFKMLRQFFEAVRNAFAGRGLRTAEGVMQDVAAGEVGAREVLPGIFERPLQSLTEGDADSDPTFDNSDIEARFQAAKDGVGSQITLRDRIADSMERAWHGITRHWINLPNVPEYAALQEKLRAIEAAPQAAKERTLRMLDDMVRDFSNEDLDLFTRKVILDDLFWDASNDRDLPFGFTRETLTAERAKIDQILEAQPSQKILTAVAKRKRANRIIAKELVDAGVLEAEQIKNPAYYRHQVLEYARAQMKIARGTGKRLRSPKWAKRMGSSLDINANLLEAEFDWLNKAFVDIPVARAIEWIKNSEHNILDRLRSEARESNRKGIEERVAEAQEIVDNPREHDAEDVAKATALISISRSFGRNIAMGFGKVRAALESGEFEYPARFEAVAKGIIEGTSDNQQPPFEFLTWMLDNNAPGAIGAAMIMKAVGQRRSWTKEVLGNAYVEPDSANDLVDKLAPEGYTTWQPDEGKLLFTVKTIPERVIDEMLMQMDTPKGVDPDIVRAALEGARTSMALGGAKYTMVLPEEVAATLNQLRREEVDSIGKLIREPVRMWKRWVLINPRRFLKYNINNLSGDLDAIIAGKPLALRRVGEAGRELYRVMKKGEKPSARYEEAVARGVFDSGLSVQEIPDIHTLEPFERFAKKPNLASKMTVLVLRKAWNGLQGFTQWREGVFRYALYLDFVDRLEAGESQASVGYGASRPNMVDAVPDLKDRAAMLARDLIGDYGAISHYGANLRETILPFWSWMEINTKRYWRLTANAYGQGVGQGLATSGGLAAWKSAQLLLRMGVLFAVISLWNNLFFDDEEDDLSEDQQRQIHMIFGRNEDGTVRTMRLQGSFSDALSWFGWQDVLAAVDDYEKGRESLGGVLLAGAKAPINKVGTSLAPTITVPLEAGFGRKIWPDVFSTRPLDDGWRNFFSTFSLENEYDLFMDRPSRGYARSWMESVLYRRDPGEMAYGEVRGKVYDWLEREKGQTGGGGVSTPRSQAMKDYRQALKFGDLETARNAWDRMVDLGVTENGYRAMMRRAAPLGPIAKKDRQAFVDQMTEDEYQAYIRADVWYRETFRPDEIGVRTDDEVEPDE